MNRDIFVKANMHKAIFAYLEKCRELNDYSMEEVRALTFQIEDEIDKYVKYQVAKRKTFKNERN